MIAFDQPYAAIDNVFFDHSDPNLLYALHDQVEIASNNSQTELSLALHSTAQGKGGGVFQARFIPTRSNPESQEWTLANIVDCRTKLTPRTEVENEGLLGQWRDAVLDGEGGFLLDFFLDAHDSQLMRQLALDDVNTLDLNIELTYLGLTQGFPFVVKLPGIKLHQQLTALIESQPVSAEKIEAAFLSLPESFLSFRAHDHAHNPGRETLIIETARRAIPLLFSVADSGIEPSYLLKSDEPFDDLAISLYQPRKQLKKTRLNWSFSTYVGQLDAQEIETHFPLLRAIEPFSKVEIRAFNHIPLDPAHAMIAKVDLKYTGRGGTQENTTLQFRQDQPSVQSISTVFPSLTHDFNVESRLRLIIAPPDGRGFPKIWPRGAAFEKADNPFLIDISPERVDVQLIQVKALDGVFDYCREVQAIITHDGGITKAKVSQEKPEVWIVLPGYKKGAEFSLKLMAFAQEPLNINPHVFQEEHESLRRIIVSPVDLFVSTPTVVTGELKNSLVKFAVLDIRMSENSKLLRKVLRQQDIVEFALWRRSVFDELIYEWRVSAVRVDNTGRNLPMETSHWKTSNEHILKIA